MKGKVSDNIKLLEILYTIIDKRIDKDHFYMEVGTVKSIDEVKQTFVLTSNEGNPESTVNMSVVTSETYIVPEVGSVVLVGYTNPAEKYCIHVQKADKIIMRNGDNGGLINIADLTTKLNDLRGTVNSILTTLKTWIPVSGDGGAALKTAAAAIQAPASFSKSDYEDENVTH